MVDCPMLAQEFLDADEKHLNLASGHLLAKSNMGSQ
jgi:hypothetical protein